ncbi:MAG: hypothetical protein ACREXP_24975 [Steroidobacteraceae bacterium]
MKSQPGLVTLSALAALTVSSLVSADNGHPDFSHQCGARTLRGLYVFSATGYNVVGGAAIPKAITLTLRFNGDGTMTVPTATIVVNGNAIAFPPNFAGTYSVDWDCTGKLQFGPNAFNLVVAPFGYEVYMNQTGNAPPALGVLQGAARRISL